MEKEEQQLSERKSREEQKQQQQQQQFHPHLQLSEQLKKQLLKRRASAESAKFSDLSCLRRDSTLSSTMSAASSSMSISSAFSALSFKSHSNNRQSFEHAQQSTSSSSDKRNLSKEKSLAASLTYSLRLEKSEEAKGILHISIEEANDLPIRDYGAVCDSFVHACLYRDRRSLRKRSRHLLQEFETVLVKKDLNPTFTHSYATEVSLSEYKTLRLKFSAYDFDRYSKTSDLGSCSILLKDIKNLSSTQEKIKMIQPLTSKKQEFGELMFGMSYLPTAQRLTFNIMKASNLRFESLCIDLESFAPYVRILHLTSNGGRVVKKKKTSPRNGTKEPVFNETLNFELSQQQLDTSVFLVLLAHKQSSFELQDFESNSSVTSVQYDTTNNASNNSTETTSTSTAQRSATSGHPTTSTKSPGIHTPVGYKDHALKDICLGRVSVGGVVRMEKGRVHWNNVLQSPRKVCTMWHDLI